MWDVRGRKHDRERLLAALTVVRRDLRSDAGLADLPVEIVHLRDRLPRGYFVSIGKRIEGTEPLDLDRDDDLLLAEVAAAVQDSVMRGFAGTFTVWPVCDIHDLGCHVDAERASWSCKGGGGHAVASIGELNAAS